LDWLNPLAKRCTLFCGHDENFDSLAGRWLHHITSTLFSRSGDLRARICEFSRWHSGLSSCRNFPLVFPLERIEEFPAKLSYQSTSLSCCRWPGLTIIFHTARNSFVALWLGEMHIANRFWMSWDFFSALLQANAGLRTNSKARIGFGWNYLFPSLRNRAQVKLQRPTLTD